MISSKFHALVGALLSLLLLAGAPAAAQTDATAQAPTSLECAAYYYLTEVSFLLAPAAAAHASEIGGPSMEWASNLFHSASKDDQMAAVGKVQHKMHELTAQSGQRNDVMAMLQPIVSYYDPACHSLAGLAPFDLAALLARAKQLTPK